MRFNDHILDYTPDADRFNYVAAEGRLSGLIAVMMGLRYRRGFMAAVKAVCSHVRDMCRASEQADRYRWKLSMLRNKAWRTRVLKDLGGESALLKWSNQPPKGESVARVPKILHARELARRAQIRICAEACANPLIVRAPCKLDEEGMFRLPPVRRQGPFVLPLPNVLMREYEYDPRPVYKPKFLSRPIMVWPDEFRVFAQLDAEQERDNATRDEGRKTPPCKLLFFAITRNTLQKRARAIPLACMIFAVGHKEGAVFVPP